MSIQDLIKDDAREFDANELDYLGETVNQLIAKQQEVYDLEMTLKRVKAEERKLSQEDIPKLMENLGFDKITLKDGRSLTVKESVQPSIPAAKRQDAYRWLDKHGHGDLIKIAMTHRFGRGEKDMAIRLQQKLADEYSVQFDIAESVHAGTLKAWAREELANGRSLPEDLIKVHVVKMTTVK